MLRFENSLPKLPIPTLEETAQKYLKSLHPLLSQTEYARSAKAVEAFLAPTSLAHELQKRLIARREDPTIRNWLTEWWNDAAYLGYRAPVVPYVSYFYSHRDDRKRRDPAKRAAAISTAVLEFKKQVDSGTLEPEYMKKLPMAMSSYEYMFNCCRIPATGADYPKKYFAEGNEHIVVVRKNGFYKVRHSVGGRQLSTTELEHQFRRIYQIAEKQPAVGVLTTEDRDSWTEMRDRLLKTSPANKAVLETIESASFLVCLDDAAPVTLVERSRQYWHGDGTNRWFDKPLQFIVNENGTSGFTGEHSMMDGTPTHRLNDTIMNWIFNDKLDFSNPEVRSDLPDPMPLRFTLDESNHRDITRAIADHVGVMAQHELNVEAYQAYGKGLMKKFRCSPDAYVQMVIQLAYHKFYGRSRPTYESAATRKFQEGRTETCRTVSDSSVAFCEAMADPQVEAERCRDLFREALEAHVKYITDAGEGKGCDRHLFGLKQLIRPREEVPELFTDPAYAYSSSWYISSSQLSSEYYNGYGWSQVIDEGWGIAYMINENSLQFNIVCKNLGAERMAFYLNEAAGEIREMMMPMLGEGGKAKL
ncbi:carnitine O-acetyltransferase, mitochondrial-like [Teratosphaeria destructans]|uniref:Carnitine O-acetyltransferase, mitochondrial n=1 Tax=Teratosphaeria destructans TaxID=418781 RepID=A0A9W7SIA8_9PEZI|nr:carnitine O-acetyltransferase, mitochondrial-like [Teratosphaeria destructans]